MQLDPPAGENILDNILFGSFISVDLQQTEHSDYKRQVKQGVTYRHEISTYCILLCIRIYK